MDNLNKQELTRFTYFRGRVGLYAILKALGVQKGDEVLTQAFTCIAVPEAIITTGAQPVYVDIEPDGYNLDAGDLREKITEHTRAVIVQHTYGIPADLDPIMEVAAEKGLPVIEDCCHTIDSRYKGKQVGTFGVGSFYSFEWGKPVIIGIGGSLVVNEQSLAQKVGQLYGELGEPSLQNTLRVQLQYIFHKYTYYPSYYWAIKSLFHLLGSLGIAEGNYNEIVEGEVGEDFKLKMAAGLKSRLGAKLTELDEFTRHSRSLADLYKKSLDSSEFIHPVVPDGAEVIYARYPLRAKNKEKAIEQARRLKVELAEWYTTPVHPLGPGEWHKVSYQGGSCPNAEARCAEVVTLPLNMKVTRKYAERALRRLSDI